MGAMQHAGIGPARHYTGPGGAVSGSATGRERGREPFGIQEMLADDLVVEAKHGHVPAEAAQERGIVVDLDERNARPGAGDLPGASRHLLAQRAVPSRVNDDVGVAAQASCPAQPARSVRRRMTGWKVASAAWRRL